jgi:hypothetical protein
MAAQLLGEDGLGYELARRLEACGAWRAWLGDDAALAQHLSSPSAWDAFLSPAPAAAALPPRPLLLLQLRVRALLFDKASAALLLSRGAGPHSVNANCECIPHAFARCSRCLGFTIYGFVVGIDVAGLLETLI